MRRLRILRVVDGHTMTVVVTRFLGVIAKLMLKPWPTSATLSTPINARTAGVNLGLTNPMDWNILLNVPFEQWRKHVPHLRLSACSFNGDGMVNSFLGKFRGRRIYGYRKHEFKDGVFTGKCWFEIEPA